MINGFERLLTGSTKTDERFSDLTPTSASSSSTVESFAAEGRS